MVLPFIIFEIFATSESSFISAASQIPNNFHTKLGIIKLLRTFEKELISSQEVLIDGIII